MVWPDFDNLLIAQFVISWSLIIIIFHDSLHALNEILRLFRLIARFGHGFQKEWEKRALDEYFI